MLNVLIEVINHLGCKPVTVLGHHTGACIAAELSVLRPDLISRVILNGPPVMTGSRKKANNECDKEVRLELFQ